MQMGKRKSEVRKPATIVTQDNGLIRVKLACDLTGEIVEQAVQQVQTLMNKKFAPRNILICICEISAIDAVAYQKAVIAIQSVPFRRLAIYGSYPGVLNVAKNMVQFVSEEKQVKLFRSADDALAWVTPQPAMQKINPARLLAAASGRKSKI